MSPVEGKRKRYATRSLIHPPTDCVKETKGSGERRASVAHKKKRVSFSARRPVDVRHSSADTQREREREWIFSWANAIGLDLFRLENYG